MAWTSSQVGTAETTRTEHPPQRDGASVPHASADPTSRSIGQTLALDAIQGFGCPLLIVNAEPDAVVVAEVELRQVAVQVLFLAVLIDAAHPSLEHAEVAFDGVGMDHDAA